MKTGEARQKSLWGRMGQLLARGQRRADPSPAERRHSQRFSFDAPVELHLEVPGHLSIVKAKACNLSRGGMLLECETLPQLMAACHVAFKLPEWGPFKGRANPYVMAEARVRHINWEGMRFGVMFARPL